MRKEQDSKERAIEDDISKITPLIRDETSETLIDEHLKEARQLLNSKNETHKMHCRQRNTVAKMHPNLIQYEVQIYRLFLDRFLHNHSREWKISNLWEYDVDSNYECHLVPEESRKYLTNWLKLLDKRRRRRGERPAQVVQSQQQNLAPRDRQRVIVQNYFKKRSPQRF